MDEEPKYIRPEGQLPIDPSEGSIILLIVSLLVLVGDIYLARDEPYRDGSFARRMPNPTKWRRAFASVFLFMAAGSFIAVASFQTDYFQVAIDLRKERARHYSIYPLTLESGQLTMFISRFHCADCDTDNMSIISLGCLACCTSGAGPVQPVVYLSNGPVFSGGPSNILQA